MTKKKRYITDFLFSTPSFLSGAGTVMNLAGNFYDYNSSDTGSEADEIALQNDFCMIGQDINDVLDEIREDKRLLV